MDWNRIEGNWKQAKGKVKEKWGQPRMTTSLRSTDNAISSKVKFSSVTAWPRIWHAKTLKTG